MSGTIPPALGNLVNLQYLNLSNNQLTGSIPTEFGNLANLKYLRTEYNLLNGSIPPELANLTSLQFLQLNRNKLNGLIPIELGNSSNLTALYIHQNGLYTDDATLRAFLDTRQPGWQNTQTIAPTVTGAVSTSPRSVTVSWTPIAYTQDGGYYQIFYQAPGGPYTAEIPSTADKNA